MRLLKNRGTASLFPVCFRAGQLQAMPLYCKYTINPLKNKPMKEKSLGCTFTIAKTKCDTFPKRFVRF